MVEAWFYRSGGEWTLRMMGHAGYAPGQDVVCAGCSAIAYALLGWAVNAHRGAVLEQRDEPGDFVLCFAGAGDPADAVFSMAEIGLRQIEKAYPENVRVVCSAGDSF